VRFRISSVVGLIGSCSLVGQFVPAPNRSPKVPGVADLDFAQVKVRHQPAAPAYPSEAKALGIQGTVVVELIIDTMGCPESAKAIEGPAGLRPAAEAYAMAWRFEPAMLNGAPQRVRFLLTMPFRLRGLPKARVVAAVIELTARAPEAQDLLPGVREALVGGLRRLGVVVVQAEGADPAKVHHLRLEVAKAPDPRPGLSLSLRCSLLRDVLAVANEPGKPISVWSRLRITPAGTDPRLTLQDQVLPLLLDILEIPELAPRTPPAAS
jgi:TonB family protein